MTDANETPDSKTAATNDSSAADTAESKAEVEPTPSAKDSSEKSDVSDTQENAPKKKEREYEKIGRCFEISLNQKGALNHFYIEMLDNKNIALERVDDDGEPTGEIAEEDLALEKFHKKYKTCSHHDCPLQPRTIDEIRKKMSDNRVELAEEHLKNGELDKAEDKYSRALKYDEESVRAQLGIGKVRMEQDRIDEAMKIFKEISEANTIYEMSNKHTFNDFGIYLRKKNLNDLAIENYEKAITIDEKDAALYFNLGRAYTEKGDLPTAIEKMKEALNVEPDFPEAKTHFDSLLKRERENLDNLLTKKPDTKSPK